MTDADLLAVVQALADAHRRDGAFRLVCNAEGFLCAETETACRDLWDGVLS